MIKRLTKALWLVLVFCSTAFSQSSSSLIGAKSTNVHFTNLLNAKVPDVALATMRNKIVIIEFWATWCAPCISSMQHLEKLQAKYGNSIQVIAVNSSDKIDKIKKYINSSKSKLWFVADTAEAIKKIFPHNIIPHTIVIDKEGIVRAVTLPDYVTETVINKLIKKQSIDLKIKDDHTDLELEDIFNPDAGVKEMFNVQSYIPGLHGSTQIGGEGIFKGRRETFINMPPGVFYKYAYQWPDSRVKDNTVKQGQAFDPAESYCLDVIVPDTRKNDLRKFMQEKLPAYFDVKVRFEKRRMKVAVIKAADDVLDKLLPSTKAYTNNGIKRNSYHVDGASMKDFIEGYLDSWYLAGKPVINETGITGKFDFKFEYEMSVKGALSEALLKFGLIL
ncbi:MAG: redoxin domain-containing protein, partial [Ferruginibacter sp.]